MFFFLSAVSKYIKIEGCGVNKVWKIIFFIALFCTDILCKACNISLISIFFFGLHPKNKINIEKIH